MAISIEHSKNNQIPERIALETFKLHGFEEAVSQQMLLDKATEFCLETLKPRDGFLGMIVRGGVGRGTGDTLSDIDYTVVFQDAGQFPTEHQGPHVWKGAYFSGIYMSFESFANRPWNPEMLHGYSHAVLLECTDKLTSLIREKLVVPKHEWVARVIDNICLVGMICRFRPEYRGWETQSEIFKKVCRGEVTAAHLDIDRGLKLVKSLLFDLNQIHYPEEKNFFIQRFSGLPLQPEGFDEAVDLCLVLKRDSETIWTRTEMLSNLIEATVQLLEKHVELPDDLKRAFYAT